MSSTPPKYDIDLSMKQFLDIDVLTAAKQRINHIIDSFDDLWVSFSGGKDSLVVLNLVEEVYKERRMDKKINVYFLDEELIFDDVIDFVTEHYKSGKYNFRYLCLQLLSEKYILGKKYEYIQWDKNRPHVRKLPDFAITDWNNVYSQYTAQKVAIDNMPGKICILTGIRASESLTRLKAICMKKNQPHLAKTDYPNIMLGRVIYDWSEKDVFKYFYDRDIKYCKIYDVQLFNKDSFRVSTPLHAEYAKKLIKVKTLYPKFYDQILQVFPECRVQAEYFAQLDRHGIINKYPRTWKGIFMYIDDHIKDPVMKDSAIKRVITALQTRKNNMAKGKLQKAFGGYPLLYVFKKIVDGNYKRAIMPTGKATKIEIEYERN